MSTWQNRFALAARSDEIGINSIFAALSTQLARFEFHMNKCAAKNKHKLI